MTVSDIAEEISERLEKEVFAYEVGEVFEIYDQTDNDWNDWVVMSKKFNIDAEQSWNRYDFDTEVEHKLRYTLGKVEGIGAETIEVKECYLSCDCDVNYTGQKLDLSTEGDNE